MPWVFNPYDEQYTIKWGGKDYKVRPKVVNELPEDVVQAFFLRMLPERLLDTSKENNGIIKDLMKIALRRWGKSIENENDIGFLETFVTGETREEVEDQIESVKGNKK